MPHRTILLHVDSPAKPPLGEACNGCGVCCASEPCPLGMLLTRRLTGACKMLRWSDADRRYRCGVMQMPPWWLPRRLAARWIAAGAGCDSTALLES